MMYHLFHQLTTNITHIIEIPPGQDHSPLHYVLLSLTYHHLIIIIITIVSLDPDTSNGYLNFHHHDVLLLIFHLISSNTTITSIPLQHSCLCQQPPYTMILLYSKGLPPSNSSQHLCTSLYCTSMICT